MLEAPGTVLTALVCKIFLQNCFFWLSFGKTCVDSAQDELFLLSVCVVFCSSCKLQKGISRAFPDLWKAVKLRGLLVHGRLQGPQPQTSQPHSGSNSSSIPVMLVQHS